MNQPEGLIERGGYEDSFLMKWSPQSPDQSSCDFFLWGLVYVPALPASIDELKMRITTARNNVTGDMLQYVWQEHDNRLDMCLVKAMHILNTYEISPRINLWSTTPKLFSFNELDLLVFKIIAFKMMSNFFWGEWDTVVCNVLFLKISLSREINLKCN